MPVSISSLLSPFFDPNLTYYEGADGIAPPEKRELDENQRGSSLISTGSSLSAPPVRELSANIVLQHMNSQKVARGEALLPAHIKLTDIEENSAVSVAWGNASRLPGNGQVCHMKGRALLFTKKQISLEKIKEILLTPSLHPEIFSGVTDSKNLSVEENSNAVFPLEIFNLQAAEDMQLLTRIRAKRFPHGIVVLRDLASEDEQKFNSAQFYDRSEFRDDQVKVFTGQFQVLEIHNGTVIIMDIDLIADDIPNIVSCETAADPGGFLSTLTGGKDIKHQLEAHAQHIFEFATKVK